MEYNGILFIIHHLVIAKSLKYQGVKLLKLEEILSSLNIHTLSFEKVNFELERLQLSDEDHDLAQAIVNHSPDWVPADSDIKTVQHKRIIELSEQLNSIFVNVTILATTLLEALINLYLSIKCIKTERKDLFKMIESVDLKKKWKSAPVIFLERYDLSFSSSPGQELKELIEIRNTFIHYNPKVIDRENSKGISGVTIEKPRIQKYSEKVRKIKVFLALPKHLLPHLYGHGETAKLISLLSDSIALSDEDKEEILKHKNLSSRK